MSEEKRQSVFRLQDVTVRFGATKALDGISLNLSAGECIGLVGPSGAGKSTLLRLLNGTISPTSGRFAIEGNDATNLAPSDWRRVRSRIGFVHQDLSLVPTMRTLRNVMCGRMGHQSLGQSMRSMLFPSKAELREVYEILQSVGIEEKMYHRTHHLSGGQQQRVAIARVLYQRPVALLADEPISGIDPARAAETIDLLSRLSHERGLTLVLSLHNIELARKFTTRLIGLREGSLAFDQPAQDVDDEMFASLYELQTNGSLPSGSFSGGLSGGET